MIANAAALGDRRLEFLLTAVLSIAIVSAAAAIAWQIGVHVFPPVDIETLRPLFIEPYWFHLKPEPVERLAYLTAVFVTYPAVLLSVWMARAIVARRLAPRWTQHALLAGLTLPLFGIAVASDTFGYVIGGVPQAIYAPQTSAIVVASVLITIALVTIVTGRWSGRLGAFFRQQTDGYLPLTLVVLVLSSLAPRLRSAEMILGDPHFEAVFYSVSQVMAGKTILADLPSQYGLYGELLAPVWWLTGKSVLAFTTMMVTFQVVAAAGLLTAARRAIRFDFVFVLCAASMIWLTGSLWASALLSPERHEYFQIWPIRFLFPALGVYLALRLARRRLTLGHAVGLGVFSGVAIVWNLDSGVPVLGGFAAVFITKALFGPDRLTSVKIVCAMTASAFITIGAFIGYLDVKAETGIRVGDWFKYQTIFYKVGFGMLPMPGWGGWIAVYATYIIGLAAGVWHAATHRASTRAELLIFVSVLGIGLFTYFQGRSHAIVLAFVCWPAVLVALLLADELLQASKRRGGAVLAWHAVPALSLCAALSCTVLVNVPHLSTITYRTVAKLITFPDQRARRAIDFVATKVGDDTTAVILAAGQGAYFAETGLSSTLPGPGWIEILLQEDYDRMLQSLHTSSVTHLFVRSERDGSVPAEFKILLDQYTVSDRTDFLLYLAPKHQ